MIEGIDLVTDGAVSHAVGEVDTARWPEQTYAVRSRIDFPRMKELFWARDKFTLTGTGEFAGTYHLFKGGRELSGRFASLETRLNDWRFAGHGRVAGLDARSLRGDEDALGLLRRQAGDRFLDEAARRSGAAGHRPPRDRLRGRRRRRVDGGARVRRPAPRRPGDRAQPADVAAGPVPRAHRRRRDSRRGGDGPAGSDAARARPARAARRGCRRRSRRRRASSTPRASRSRRGARRRASRSCSRRRSAAPSATSTVRSGSRSRPAGSRRRRPTSSCRAGPRGAIDRRWPST